MYDAIYLFARSLTLRLVSHVIKLSATVLHAQQFGLEDPRSGSWDAHTDARGKGRRSQRGNNTFSLHNVASTFDSTDGNRYQHGRQVRMRSETRRGLRLKLLNIKFSLFPSVKKLLIIKV